MFTISENITFEEGINFSQNLLTKMSDQQIQPEEIKLAISSLVETQSGARGFFVTYLTAESSLPDHPCINVIEALKSSPEIVSELLVKNLAMSAAMAITHRRNHDEKMAQSSQMVCQRTTNLIQQLQLTEITLKIQQLQDSIVNDHGVYAQFLKRWGYDLEQKQEIEKAIAKLLPI
jgi:hypothetical protein